MNMARQYADAESRSHLIDIAQRWLELAEHAERDLAKHYLRCRSIEAVIGEELRRLYEPAPYMPPQLSTLLSRLDGREYAGAVDGGEVGRKNV